MGKNEKKEYNKLFKYCWMMTKCEKSGENIIY